MDQKQHSCGVLPWKLFTLVAKSDDFTLDLQKREKYVYYASLHLIFQLSSWISINISPWTAMSVKRIRNWKKISSTKFFLPWEIITCLVGLMCTGGKMQENLKHLQPSGKKMVANYQSFPFLTYAKPTRNLHSKNGFHASTPFFIRCSQSSTKVWK